MSLLLIFWPRGISSIMFFICRMTSCSPREQKDIWLLSFWLLIVNHHPVNFCIHVINGLCDFVDTIFSSEATSLSILVAIASLMLKYNVFHLLQEHLIIWSKGYVTLLKVALHLTYQRAKYGGDKSCGSWHIIHLVKRQEGT